MFSESNVRHSYIKKSLDKEAVLGEATAVLKEMGFISIHVLTQFARSTTFDIIATKGGKDWVFNVRTISGGETEPAIFDIVTGYVRAHLVKYLWENNGGWEINSVIDDSDMSRSDGWKRTAITGIDESYIESQRGIDPNYMRIRKKPE